MKTTRTIGMVLFSLIYMFCSILFFISGFLPLYKIEYIRFNTNFNIFLFVGGISYFFNSILLFYSSYKRDNWTKKKNLIYLRIIMIIGIIITAISFIMFMPFFNVLNNDEFPTDTITAFQLYGGFLLSSYSSTVLIVMTLIIIFYFISLYTKIDINY